MKLNYKMLWFEDDRNIVREDVGPEIKRHLDNLGFKLEILHFENGDNVEKLIEHSAYDLVLTDLNLGDGHEAGEKIIKNIRNHKVFTEVLLYSGNVQGINDIIQHHGLIERVSFLVGVENLTNKIKQIIDLTIRRVQDINNMRGLVMAETSELDHKMVKIINEYFLRSNETRITLLENYIYSAVSSSLKSNMKKCDKLNVTKAIITLLDSPIFDADKKRRTVDQVLEWLDVKELSDVHNCMESYKEEVLDIRNVLAHVKEEVNDIGETILVSKVKGYETFSFNDKMCIQIRKNIHKHSENLDNLLQYILQKVVKDQTV